MLSSDAARERIEKLKKTVNHHRYLYHVLDKQEISDAALDSLKKELADLEREYPQFLTEDSPTQRVGGRPLDKFKKVSHQIKQWSYDDVFSEEEIREFDEKVKRFLVKEVGVNNPQTEYTCELKIDGFKIVLTYEKGLLKNAATRGDGVIGEEVTQNVKTIESVPLKLEKEIDAIVEGEIWMSKREFERQNKEQEKRAGQFLLTRAILLPALLGN
jgi:DNA ligase (NAD+)